MLWQLIPYITGGLSFLATEIGFSIVEGNAATKPQRHFWSTVFAIFGLVFSMSVSSSIDVSNELARLNRDDLLSLIRTDASLGKIVKDYNVEFGQRTDCMKEWSSAALNEFDQSIRSGWLNLLKDAPRALSSEYHEAHSDIVATQVGKFDYYFKHQTYIEANQKMAKPEKHVPVIRFFLWNKDFADAGDFSSYVGKSIDLSKTLNTLCSVIIDVDIVNPSELHDYLLVDRRFVAETLPKDYHTWDLESARASENPSNIKAACSYLSGLYDLSGNSPGVKYVCLADPEVQTDFSASEFYPKLGTTGLARAMYAKIMEQVKDASRTDQSVLTASTDGWQPQFLLH